MLIFCPPNAYKSLYALICIGILIWAYMHWDPWGETDMLGGASYALSLWDSYMPYMLIRYIRALICLYAYMLILRRGAYIRRAWWYLFEEWNRLDFAAQT